MTPPCDRCPLPGEVEVVWVDGRILRLCHAHDAVMSRQGYLRPKETTA